MKFTVKTHIIISFFLLTFSTMSSQYTGPKPVVVGDTITNNYQVIYPLGWSEDGIFAYIHQDINILSASQDYYYYVTFQNMETNEVLWHEKIEYKLGPNQHFPVDDTMYNSAFFKLVIWSSYYSETEKKIIQYKIKREDAVLLSTTNLPKGISIKETETKNDSDSEISVRYNIKLFKPHKFKPVYNYDCTRMEDPCNLNESIWYRTFAVKGYFKSPFENRIAILVFKETNGFEEPYEYPFLVGAHLEKGFMDMGCKK